MGDFLSEIDEPTVLNRFPVAFEQIWRRKQSWLPASRQPLWFSISLSASADTVKVTDVVRQLVDRHEVLRTRWALPGDPPAEGEQAVLSVTASPVEFVDDVGAWTKANVALAAAPDSPWSRCAVELRAGHGGTLVLLVEAHAADCWSMAILREELLSLLSGEDAGQIPALQFGDYASWQRECWIGGHLDDSVSYWSRILHDAHRPRFPGREPGEVSEAADRFQLGSEADFAIDGPALAALRRAVAGTRTSIYMMTMAAVSVLVGRLCGEDSVLIETVAANRASVEAERIVGLLATPLFLHIDVTGDLSAVLAHAREAILSAHDHVGGHPAAVIEAAPRLSWLAEPTAGLTVRFQFVPATDPDAQVWDEPLVLPPAQVTADIQVIVSDIGDSVVGDLRVGRLLSRQTAAAILAHELQETLSSMSIHAHPPDAGVSNVLH
jgi:hypothetical protein